MPINWVDVPDPRNPPAGAPKINAANMARLALVEDIGVAGTPTGDAGRAVFVGKGSLLLNVKDYGAKGDGVTDDTAAIDAAVAALPAVTSTFGTASGILCFPPGRYLTSGGHILPNRTRVIGSGPYSTIIYRKSGSTGDLLTLNAQFSGIEHLTLDGGVGGAPAGGDGLVLNAAYGYALHARVYNNAGTGIAIGKTTGAIGFRLTDLDIGNNRGNGIRVYAGATTDGTMVNVNIGQSGLAGLRLSAGAQQLTGVHIWQSGLEATTRLDKAGFYIDNCRANMLVNCESETNVGDGILIVGSAGSGDSQGITGCDTWGNALAGLYSFGGTRWHTITGTRFRNNGTGNAASGASAPDFASIYNESGTEWTVTGNTMIDTGETIGAGSYSNGYVPRNPYQGRPPSTFTVSRHYAEVNTSGVPDYCAFVGNVWRSSRTRTGLANLFVGTNHQQAANIV